MKQYKIIDLVSAVIWLILSVVLFGLYTKMNNLDDQMTEQKKQVKVNQETLQNIEKPTKLVYSEPFVKTSDDAYKAATQFFKIYYDYASSDEYNDRVNQLPKGLVADKVADGKLFITDREETGEDYIDNNDIATRFDNAQTYYDDEKKKYVVIVSYDASGNGYDDYADSRVSYDMQYDESKQQISDLKYRGVLR